MEEKKIEISYKVLKTKELLRDDIVLRKNVIEAANNAYAPYSKYNVGAVVVFKDSSQTSGNNQENAAYPSGLCAERVALFSAGANYPDCPIDTLGVIAMKGGKIQPSVSPCGACRQVLLEMEQRQEHDIRVVLFGRDEAVIFSSAKDLLPLCFEKMNVLSSKKRC